MTRFAYDADKSIQFSVTNWQLKLVSPPEERKVTTVFPHTMNIFFPQFVLSILGGTSPYAGNLLKKIERKWYELKNQSLCRSLTPASSHCSHHCVLDHVCSETRVLKCHASVLTTFAKRSKDIFDLPLSCGWRRSSVLWEYEIMVAEIADILFPKRGRIHHEVKKKFRFHGGAFITRVKTEYYTWFDICKFVRIWFDTWLKWHCSVLADTY